jgi:hypothetical protein
MHTLISAFEDRASAERAVERLHELGFAPDDVHLKEHHDIGDGEKGDFDNDRGILPSYGRAFASILGMEPPESNGAEHYASAHERGHPLVVVSVDDDDRADIAGDALQQMGAVDVHERAGAQSPAEAKHRGVLRFSRERA